MTKKILQPLTVGAWTFTVIVLIVFAAPRWLG